MRGMLSPNAQKMKKKKKKKKKKKLIYMVRKKIDNRIRILIENCVKTNHRSLFLIIGDKAKEQVVNLHYIQSKTIINQRPSVLWCYKKELVLYPIKKNVH